MPAGEQSDCGERTSPLIHSAASILRSVKEQEAQFEQLAREIELERRRVADQVGKVKLGSESASVDGGTTNNNSHYDHLDNDAPVDGDASMSSSQLVDSCLRVLHDKEGGVPQYSGQPETQQTTSTYNVDVSYHPASNGHPENPSPNSSQLSVHSGGAPGDATLISRTQKQQTTQQVTTVTKVIREVQHIGPDGQPIDYLPYSTVPPTSTTGYPTYNPAAPPPAGPYPGEPYLTHSPADPGARRYPDPNSSYPQGYRDYEHYPGPYQNASPYRGYQNYGDTVPYSDQRQPNYSDRVQLQPGYGERPPTPPSPSERSDSPPPQQAMTRDYMRSAGASYPQSGYDELDTTLMPPPRQDYRNTPSPGGGGQYGYYPPERNLSYGDMPISPYGTSPRGYDNDMGLDHRLIEGAGSAPRAVFDDEDEPPDHPPPSRPSHPSPSFDGERVRWRDPDLHEVIEFLSNPNNVIKANAAAYLQHLCYMDDPIKQKTRALGGIPPLVALLGHELPEIYRNACGALRNLSYGRQNDENKKAIKNAGGIPALVRLMRKVQDNELKELVTGVLWNLSSCEDLKRPIIDDGLTVLVNSVIIPHSGWDRNTPGQETHWSTVFKNASGVLRNVSSAGEYARRKLRECDGLVDSLLYLVRSAIEKSNIDHKIVENCVCILRNLSFRCQEVEDPQYDKHQLPMQSRAGAAPKGEEGDNLGCFGASKKKKETQSPQHKEAASSSRSIRASMDRGMDLLWQPEQVVPLYLNLLSNCSNPETLEAAAGAIQNLAACYWQPSIDIRAVVRKEKGLPILVELLRMEVDRVVCAVATALRNLAIDQRNKELIGKYAMRDLVQKLPSGNPQHDQGTSDETIAAVLATLNEVIKKNAEFSRSLLEASGVERLMNITRQRQKYSSRVIKFASQVLYSMWQHQELREVYKKSGWKETDFVTKTVAARNARPSSPSNANSTLNRPMASQGGTRYEDRTMQRGANLNTSTRSPGPSNYSNRAEDVPMADMPYPDGGSHAPVPPPGGVRMYPPPPQPKPGEPVYAQVNREKKKSRQYDHAPPPAYESHIQPGPGDMWGYEDQPKGTIVDGGTQPGGDSWV